MDVSPLSKLHEDASQSCEVMGWYVQFEIIAVFNCKKSFQCHKISINIYSLIIDSLILVARGKYNVT